MEESGGVEGKRRGRKKELGESKRDAEARLGVSVQVKQGL